MHVAVTNIRNLYFIGLVGKTVKLKKKFNREVHNNNIIMHHILIFMDVTMFFISLICFMRYKQCIVQF